MVRGTTWLYVFFLLVGLVVLGTNIYLFTLVMHPTTDPTSNAVNSGHKHTPKPHKPHTPHRTHHPHAPRADDATKAPHAAHHEHKHKEKADKPLEKPPKPKRPRTGRSAKELAEKRQAFHVSAEGYSTMNYTEALAQYEVFMTTKLDIEQSSNKFTDFFEDSHAGIVLPEEPIIAGPDTSSSGSGSNSAVSSNSHPCDPRENRFTPSIDRACREYLADPRSWRSIKPMSSILSTGRTIKFKVYLNNGAEAVMKISQKKFALEPSSEVMAFIVDRRLNFNRVPPVQWIGFPLKYLKAACATKGDFYSQWFDQFVVKYHPSNALIHTDKESNEQLLYVSLQLWMSDVHDADETVLQPPHGLKKLLDAATPLPSDLGVDAKTAATELSDIALFDFIIGNTDRWTGHNSFVFGGCRTCVTKPDTEILGTPTYAFIDQGSSFYKNDAPEHNLYNKGNETDKNIKLCRFRKTTVESLVKVAHPEGDALDLGGYLRNVLPKGVMHLSSSSLIKSTRKRLDTLVRMIENCEKTFSPAAVRSL